jgi:hypothetical protein
MTKWFQPGIQVKGISKYANTFGKKGIVVRGRDTNGRYIVRWDNGTVESVGIHEIASMKFEV